MERRFTAAGGVLGGIALGAGLMYLLDPDRGRRRRAIIRDKVTSSARGVACGVNSLAGLSRDLRNRAYGLLAETRGRFRKEAVPDEVLEARVRSRMGHKIPHPEWVDVKADHGVVTLEGRIPAADATALLAAVSSVRGVKEVAIQVH